MGLQVLGLGTITCPTFVLAALTTLKIHKYKQVKTYSSEKLFNSLLHKVTVKSSCFFFSNNDLDPTGQNSNPKVGIYSTF